MDVFSESMKSRSNEYLSDFFKKIFSNPKYLFLISGIFGATLIAVLIMWMKTPEYQILYSNVSDQDGGAIISELSSANIPYKFSNTNGSIMIPADQIYKTRLLLAQKNLPKGGSVGFEILDSSSFGISQFNEQINYQRALEGEIARTIEILNPIKSARVHIAIPKNSVFIKDKQPARASITLTLHPGRILDNSQIQAITWLVSGTTPNLPASNIVLVDNHGKLLTQIENKENNNSTQLKYTREIESEYRRRIEDILIPIVGINNIRAEVTAQMDFTKIEQTLEQHKPNTNPEEMTIRSQQITENKNFGNIPEGVPGALSNQPAQVASTDILPTNENIQSKPSSSENLENISNNTEKSSNIQNEKIINYEIDRTITHNQFSPGILKKLSVAVVINNRNIDGNQIKLNDQEMRDINSLVRETMGFSENRGDTLDIVNINFADNQEEVSHIYFWENIHIQNIIISMIKYVISFILIWFIWNKFIKIWKNQQKTQQDIIKQTSLQKDNNLISEDQDTQLKNQKNIENDNILIENKIKDLKEIATKQPKLVAKILSQWIEKEKQTS
ncbi:MAG: flagellar M-ring protein FliF [Wigglesworthia glossinidia]|nr:flagellar M-ring protein FliF [Wigglesworthia glossinidia]